MDDKREICFLGLRPRIRHEYGDGYVLSVTLEELEDPLRTADLLKDLQKGYIKITLEK